MESTVQEKALSASSSRPGGAPRTLVGSMEMVLPLMRSFTSATTGSVKFGGVPVSCASEAEVLVGEMSEGWLMSRSVMLRKLPSATPSRRM